MSVPKVFAWWLYSTLMVSLDSRFMQAYRWLTKSTLWRRLKVNRKIAMLIPLALAIAPAALAQDNYHVTTPSSWKLNASQSDFGGDPNAMKSDLYHVTRDTDKWLAYSETMVGPDGKAMH